MPEHTIPASLVEQIKNGRAVLVVGAGVGVPSWKQLLEAMNDELSEARGANETDDTGTDEATSADPGDGGDDGDDDDEVSAGVGAASRDVARLLHKGNLTRAAGFLARSLGEEACDRIVSETWATPDEIPVVARALAALPFRHVWTTFPGDLLEDAMAAHSPDGWPEPAVATYQQAGEIRPRRRTLLKILGDFDSYVVTPKSVRSVLSRAADLRAYVHDFYSDGALVFVGFRYGDPDLSALLDRVFGMFEPPEREHYMIASGVGPVTLDELAHEHHIEVINLPGKGADETAMNALVDYLETLRAACDQAGATLAQTRPDDDDLEGWFDALRGAIAAGADGAADAAEAREQIARIEVEAREADEVERLIDVLVGRVETEETANGRASLLMQLADVFETKVGDLPQAFTALTAALREDPSDAAAVDAAERLAHATGAWSELVADVSAVAGEVTDDAVAAGLWARLGGWYHAHLDHADYALAAFRQAIKQDPACTAAYAGLAELCRKQQKWAELADVLRDHVEVEPETERKIDLYLALGDLCETQLASTSRAIEAYQAAADLDPSQDDALAALERLYRRDERWGKLAVVLEQRAEILDDLDSPRAAAMRRELATLRAEKLGDVEGAIGKYEAALAADEGDVDALRALIDLYEKVGRTDDYLRALERLADASPESEQSALLRRIAAEVEDREDGRARAVECYTRIVEIEPAAEDAYRELERILRQDERWADLAEAYERHVEAVKVPATRVELHVRLADIYENQLADPDRAIEAHMNALAVRGDHRESLAGLARLYERIEAWDRATDTLVEHAELEGNRGADLWYRAGSCALHTGHGGGDGADDRAEGYFEKALAIDAAHTGALRALADLSERRGNYASAVKLLTSAEEHTTSRPERIELLLRAASLASARLGDGDRALALWRRVLDHDPEHAEAGALAARALVDGERWADAIPILDMVTRVGAAGLAGDGDRASRPAVVAHAAHEEALARAHAALGRPAEAARHYRAAADADPDNLAAALGLAASLYDAADADHATAREGGRAATGSDAQPEADDAAASGDGADTADTWAEINKRYREVLARQGESLPAGEIAVIWYRLGVVGLRLGDDRKAEAAFRRVLERDPHHGPSLDHLAEIAEARGDWKTAIEVKRGVLAAWKAGARDLAERDRVQLLSEVGQLTYEKLGDPDGALVVYREALTIRPGSRALLHKVLDVHTDRGSWSDAIDTLAELAENERNQQIRAKYHYTAAVIARDELEDTGLAALQFDFALDSDPGSSKTFDALDEMLTQREDWSRLAGAYRKMLKRLGEDASRKTLVHLWTRLGDICADHLGDLESAIAAFEVASSLDPDDLARHEQLADLYLEAGETRRNDAIDALQVLIRNDPDRVELYRVLSTLYREEGELDKSFCASQVLVFLGAASEDEVALYERHRPDEFSFAKRRLTEELWQTAIIHHSEDRRLDAVFSSLCGSIAATTGQPASAFELTEDQRTDPDRDHHLVSKVFKYASNILALDPEPRLYLQRKSGDGIRVANTVEGGKLAPSVLVGVPYVRKDDERELAFEVGKRLAYFRPERYVHYALQTLPKLESAIVAALAASGATDAKPAGDAARLATHIEKTVPKAVLDQVRAVGRKLEKTPVASLAASWRNATDLTANRIGLILCNDLETAARLVATEQGGISTLPVKDRLRELLAYAVSEDYFAIRRHLGIDLREDAR